jgi:hypothetical protein
VNTGSNISQSQCDEQFSIWPDQTEALASGYWRLGPEQTPLDSYRGRFVVPIDLTDCQASPSWPKQTQSGSGTLTAFRVVFPTLGPNETSLVDPYSSGHQTFFVQGSYESNTRVSIGIPSISWRSPKVLAEAEADIQVIKELASPLLGERWDNENDLRFDVLVKKEALGRLNPEEAEELEQLSDKRDRTVTRVPDEDLLRERMRNKALTELQNLLEKYAPLFARRR